MENASKAVYSCFVNTKFSTAAGKAGLYEPAYNNLVAAIEELDAQVLSAGVDSSIELIEKSWPENPEDLPQLVVIDGGKGQLAFAFEALAELGLTDKLMVVALAERMEEVYRVGDPYPMFIDRNSPALKVLQQIRDEAHRFGITFHRKLRSKAQIESVLKTIKGVGEKTEQRLLLRFGSVARIASAPIEEVAELVGKSLAEKIMKELNKKDE